MAIAEYRPERDRGFSIPFEQINRELIDQRRRERRWSRRALAARAGVGKGTVYRIMQGRPYECLDGNGKRTTVTGCWADNLWYIARALDLTLNDLWVVGGE